MMKKSVILVNEARGAVLDEEAVTDAVLDGRIGGFGCDVYSTEPFPAEHPFTAILNESNVCLTPHMAWGAYGSRKRCMDEIYKNLEDDISPEMLAQHYNDTMRNAYMGDKLNGIIPCMSIFEFIQKLKELNNVIPTVIKLTQKEYEYIKR